jgi:CheY-specific phosphatase CheX
MHTDLEFEPYVTDICQFTGSVFLSMLGLEVQPSDAELPSTEMITGAIYYAGPWKGALLLQCAASAAYEFTARLMGVPQPVGFDDDVRDAMGEMTNIIAGNLKPILPRGVGLSMPSVIQGLPSAIRICGDVPLLRLAFLCESGPFWMTILGLSEDPS